MNGLGCNTKADFDREQAARFAARDRAVALTAQKTQLEQQRDQLKAELARLTGQS